MGFLSFITNDTNKSISNCFSSRGPLTVYLVDCYGNEFKEENYQGYGKFGGKDFFDVIANMNGIFTDEAVELYYKNSPDLIYPNLNESPGLPWKDERPARCPDQGYFYDF